MAAIIVAYCFSTAIFFHNAWSDVNQLMHFWKNMTMAGGLMQVVAFGAGRIAWMRSAGRTAQKDWSAERD